VCGIVSSALTFGRWLGLFSCGPVDEPNATSVPDVIARSVTRRPGIIIRITVKRSCLIQRSRYVVDFDGDEQLELSAFAPVQWKRASQR